MKKETRMKINIEEDIFGNIKKHIIED